MTIDYYLSTLLERYSFETDRDIQVDTSQSKIKPCRNGHTRQFVARRMMKGRRGNRA